MSAVCSQDLIGVGWDVRGWQSNQQATAVARFRVGTGSVEWLGVSDHFGFSKGSLPGLKDLIAPALRAADTDVDLSAARVAIAIDAPLSLPKALGNLIAGHPERQQVPAKEIDNRLAYRDCERWIESKFGKKPLSAPFDKLGNNATLAISVSQQLEREGFTLVPQSALASDRALIEVYPALAKAGPQKTDPAVSVLGRHLPTEIETGTDQYDAAISALLGLIYLGAGPEMSLPELIPFPKSADPQEGWIFALPPGLGQGEVKVTQTVQPRPELHPTRVTL